jgi:hypothetical protein
MGIREAGAREGKKEDQFCRDKDRGRCQRGAESPMGGMES